MRVGSITILALCLEVGGSVAGGDGPAADWRALPLVKDGKVDPSWVQIREYSCPGCGVQLEVEAVPRGCPPDFEFLPDLDTFYRDWLERPLPDKQEFADKTLDVVRTWSEE